MAGDVFGFRRATAETLLEVARSKQHRSTPGMVVGGEELSPRLLRVHAVQPKTDIPAAEVIDGRVQPGSAECWIVRRDKQAEPPRMTYHRSHSSEEKIERTVYSLLPGTLAGFTDDIEEGTGSPKQLLLAAEDLYGDLWALPMFGMQLVTFTLTENKPAASAAASVDSYLGGPDPGSSITVNDQQLLWPRAITGCKGQALFIGGAYQIMALEQETWAYLGKIQGELTENFTLGELEVVGDGIGKSGASPTITGVNPFEMEVDPNNPWALAVWDKTLGQWVLIQVKCLPEEEGSA